jgi:hypothetical protein
MDESRTFSGNAAGKSDLSTCDFSFDGPIGSQGAVIEKVGKNHFHITLGHAPGNPGWCNMLYFRIMRNARGNSPRIDVSFQGGDDMRFNHNSATWSYDCRNWHAIDWVNPDEPGKQGDSLLFPGFREDAVWFGAQVPMSHQDVEAMMKRWGQHLHARINVIGKSLGGRNLYRLEVTDPNSGIPPAKRWVHRFANEHPGEHNSQWRMAGMVDWLLSDNGTQCRRKNICHFIIMMSPDGPGNGWYRVNAEGFDMNRTYLVDGSGSGRQAHEAFIVQKDMESLMASQTPVTTSWSMHTWGGPVEPIFQPGPEFGTKLGSFEEFKNIVADNDPGGLIKPLAVRKNPIKLTVMWSSGVYAQFGITTVLCEGAGRWTSKQKSLDAGMILMKSIAGFYQ